MQKQDGHKTPVMEFQGCFKDLSMTFKDVNTMQKQCDFMFMEYTSGMLESGANLEK